MNPKEQVDYLKHSITEFLAEFRGKNDGGFSLEGFIHAANHLEQALNIHDCQDPAVGCSCSGSVRFPTSTPTEPQVVIEQQLNALRDRLVRAIAFADLPDVTALTPIEGEPVFSIEFEDGGEYFVSVTPA